jgi:hypothetical protein
MIKKINKFIMASFSIMAAFLIAGIWVDKTNSLALKLVGTGTLAGSVSIILLGLYLITDKTCNHKYSNPYRAVCSTPSRTRQRKCLLCNHTQYQIQTNPTFEKNDLPVVPIWSKWFDQNGT